MTNELWQALVQFTGGVNALLLGAILIFSPRMHRTRARQKLGLALLAYGYLLFSFTAVDNLWIPPSWQIVLADYVIVLVASALFFDYMSSSLGRSKVSKFVYLPSLLFLGFALFMGSGFILGPAINVVVIAQIAYTCLTTWVYLKSSRNLASRVYHLRALLIGLWILHAFQFSRMLLPDIGWLFDTVPLVGTALVLAFTALVLTDSRTLRAFNRVIPEPQTHATTLDDVDLYMRSEQPYLDSRLTLDQLAAAVDAPPRHLSQLIGTADGNFYNFVNRYRVDEAKRLLADRREGRTSIEAISLMAGFRARSTFYEAFKRDSGITPAQYREDLPKPAE